MTIFLSTTDGDDTRTLAQAQSSATPWKTLTKLNANWGSINAGDTISFKAGDVFPGSITPNKSGTSALPIHFNSYSTGAKPIVTGFTPVTSWSNSLGGNLWQSSAAISALSTLKIVMVNGAFTPIGKWPTIGFQPGPILPALSAPAGSNKVDSHTGAVGTTGTTHTITSAGLAAGSLVAPPTQNWVGGELVIKKRHWIIDNQIITAHNSVTNTLSYTAPTIYDCINNFGFFIQNHQAACDTQGEWWYDSTTKKIGMYSVGAPTGVEVASVDTIVNIGTFSWYTFTGIEFRGANSNAFLVSSGSNHVFTSCDFKYMGKDVFTCQVAVNHISLINCTSLRVNNNVVTGGTSSNWSITGCTFSDTGLVAGMGFSDSSTYSALANIGPNSLVELNTFINSGYIAIDFRGSSITVNKNLVLGFCQVKDDGSGIYTYTGGTTTVYAQRFVTDNIVLNGGGASPGTTTSNSDATAFYWDANTSNVTMTGNTAANNGMAGLFLNGDHDLIIDNNTFYNNVLTGGYGQILEVYPTSDPTALVRNITFTNNIVVSRAATQLVAHFSTSESNMSAWGTWNNNRYCRPINENGATFQLNKSSGNQLTNLAGWKASSGLDAASQVSPITITNLADLRFEYNATNAPVVVSLGANYIDMRNVAYPGSITIPAFRSAVLIRTGGIVAAPARGKGYING
jgi:parallel beta-helix repeat protein